MQNKAYLLLVTEMAFFSKMKDKGLNSQEAESVMKIVIEKTTKQNQEEILAELKKMLEKKHISFYVEYD